MDLLSRRSAVLKLCALSVVASSAQLFPLPTARAMGWSDLVTLAGKLPSFSEITNDIKNATDNVIATYDAVTLRVWKAKLAYLRVDIIDLNALKSNNLQDIQNYLDSKPLHKSWSELQSAWSSIPKSIEDLKSEIHIGNNAVDMTAATKIKDVLSQQYDFYTALSTMQEPQNSQQLSQFRETVEDINGLYNQIKDLEKAIDDYVAKHP